MGLRAKEETSSFASLGVHPTLASALQRSGVQATPFMSRVLATTTADFADILVDGRAASGGVNSGGSGGNGSDGNGGGLRAAAAERHTLITVFAAHCLLAAKDTSRSIAVVIASNKDCAVQLQKSMRPFASRCHISCHVHTSEGQEMPHVLSAAAAGGGGGGEKGSPPSGTSPNSKGGHVIITTLRVLCTWGTEFLRSVTTLIVEDASRCDERSLEDILRALTSSSSSSSSAAVNTNYSPNNSTAAATSRQTPNIFLMYLMPLTKVSSAIRYQLSRRNRRYYHLQAPPPTTGAAQQTPSGTAPPSSTQLVHLLCLDEKDREDLLRRVLQVYHSRRVLLLTHHKEIKQLYRSIVKWGIYRSPNDANNRGSDYMSCILRSDTTERQESTLMNFIRDSNNNNVKNSGNNNNENNKNSSALLVGWDAFTAVDLMDLDVLIQYYPPQKSLTERERAEFVQVLHTTADPENNRRRRRTLLITFLAINDFTLASFFMQQYGQNGPILNIAPNHPEFQQCIGDPKAVLRIKQKKEKSRREKETREENSQQPNASSTSSGGAASAPLPLPRSMRNPSPGMRKEKEHHTGGGNSKGNANNNNNSNTAAAAGRGGGGGGGNSRGGGK